MKLIGITGKSGSGKSTLTQMLNHDNNYNVINMDSLVHSLLEKEQIKLGLVDMFGSDILENNVINRKKLGAKVFANKACTDQYNNYIYEFMKKEIDSIISTSNKDIILDWPMLTVTHYFEKCDYTILVVANSDTRQDRVVKRDNIKAEYHKNRDLPDELFEGKLFDIVVDNDNGLQTLQQYADEILRQIEG